MRRLRTSYVDDWEDMELTDNPRVRLFGISVHPLAAMGGSLVAVVVMVVLSWVSNRGWLSDDPRILWSITGVCVLGLVGIMVITVMSTWVMAKALRNSRLQLAKLDGATDEEARYETERFMRRNLYFRMGAYALVSVGIWLLLGSPLVFPWGGPLPFLGGILTLAVVFLLLTVYRRQAWDALLRIAGRRR